MDGRLLSALEADDVDDEFELVGAVELVCDELVEPVARVPGEPGEPKRAAACKNTESALARAAEGDRNDA
jgi:hypothetical protein